MSSADATIHAKQYLICALQNPAPDSPLVTLVNEHNEALISLADIFGKSTSPTEPPGAPVEGEYQDKLQHMNQ